MSSAPAIPSAPERMPVMKMIIEKRWNPSLVHVNGRGCPLRITMSCSSNVRPNAIVTSMYVSINYMPRITQDTGSQKVNPKEIYFLLGLPLNITCVIKNTKDISI